MIELTGVIPLVLLIFSIMLILLLVFGLYVFFKSERFILIGYKRGMKIDKETGICCDSRRPIYINASIEILGDWESE